MPPSKQGLEVEAELHVTSPAGPITVTGRGRSLTLELRPSALRQFIHLAWRERKRASGAAKILARTGLGMEVRSGGRVVARLGADARRGIWMALFGSPSIELRPLQLFRALVAGR
jgi:hypothetical protein